MEVDPIASAELIDLPVMARLIRNCSGIVCRCLDVEQVARLGLHRLVERNESRHGTPFTVSIEAREGLRTDLSAADRLTAVQSALAPDDAAKHRLVRACLCTVRRRGWRAPMGLASLRPAATPCELKNPDGRMARVALVAAHARQFALLLLSVEDGLQVRLRPDQLRNASSSA